MDLPPCVDSPPTQHFGGFFCFLHIIIWIHVLFIYTQYAAQSYYGV